MWYWFLKFAVVGPILKLAYAPRWLGKENLPRSGGYVLAANHTGVIETAIVPFGVRRRVTFVAKSKYYRGSGAKGRLLFPEGTRSPDGRMYRGRTGAMRVALPMGVPVIPAAVSGAHGSGPRWTWGKGTSQRITVTYLPPLDTSPWVGRENDPQACRPGPDARTTRRRGARRPRRSWPRSAR